MMSYIDMYAVGQWFLKCSNTEVLVDVVDWTSNKLLWSTCRQYNTKIVSRLCNMMMGL